MNSILEIIDQYQPLKRWRERNLKTNKTAMIRKIVKILRWISGNDLQRMMKDVLSSKKYRFSKLTKESRTLNKIIPHLNSRIRQKHKHVFLKSFRDSGFSFEDVTFLGFKFSQYLWYSCLDSRERKVGGRLGFHDYLRPKINTFLEINSEIGANRTSLELIKPITKRKKNGVIIKQKNERIIENVRYLNDGLEELQKKFTNEINDEFEIMPSKFSFLRLRKKQFKKPKRQTDLCDYCQLGKTLKKNINRFILDNYPDLYDENFDLQLYLREFSRGFPDQEISQTFLNNYNQNYLEEILNTDPNADIPFDLTENFDEIPSSSQESKITSETSEINQIQIDLNESDSDPEIDTQEPNSTSINRENVLKQLKILSQIEFHKNIARIQRESYNKMIKETNIFYHDSIVIEFDFKQKIVYGNFLVSFK